MLACRLAWESKGIAKSVTLWTPRLAWGRQGRVNHDYNRLVIAFRPKQEPWALSVTNCVVINLIIQGNMGKEGLPAPGVTGRRPGPLPKGPASGGRLPVCSLYPGLAGRNRKRCCEGDPVSWACLTWRGLREKSLEGLAVVRCPWAAGLTGAWESFIIFELEGGQYDIVSEREARNRHVIQEATKRDPFWAQRELVVVGRRDASWWFYIIK